MHVAQGRYFYIGQSLKQSLSEYGLVPCAVKCSVLQPHFPSLQSLMVVRAVLVELHGDLDYKAGLDN